MSAVPFSKWVAELKEIEASGNAAMQAMPALKVLDFFAGMEADLRGSGNRSLDFETGNSKRASQAMANLRAIDASAMSVWLDQWAF